ncbi:ABC transporter ATP-binding protein [Clostridium sp. SM-530-WT-3G]|uniref:ABC transporter ATP-binding protein n=1 Tax=Clostridium sp. SM-530-WT-3G TaxID=2725303 RepID=UPI000EC33D65|nr:ABC transporter ATP-binding protein [Clostridium sp. SM-530-WT-3G]NME83235.1 ABC transporter ATP-binding protein [Clostridium sp. SM-530-WT-3G]HCW54060.1 sodium ABC transporter ATP-binding protein [Clostridium sp.]
MEAIKLRNLKKNYADFSLDIDKLDVKTGFITGFIGRNGSGKTTTINLIMGMLKPDGGEVKVFGESVVNNGNIKNNIGYIGDISGFLEENKLKYIKNGICRFYSNWDEKVYKKYMNKFNLDENKSFKDLSKGQQKQFQLVMAFSHHPKLLIMDEPTANLDPIVRNEILDIINNHMVNEEVTVFYSSHITTDIEKCADYIVFINDGKIFLQGEKDEILENHILVKFKKDLYDENIKSQFVSLKENRFGYEGLMDDKLKAREIFGNEAVYEKCSLDDILIYYVG